MKRILLMLAVALLFNVLNFEQAQAQNTKQTKTVTSTTNRAKVAWSKTIIDSTFNPTCCDISNTGKVIQKYKPTIENYGKIIGYCPKGLERGNVEAPLSNWAVDNLYEYARHYLDTTNRKDVPLDFAILNFGGMRTEMPKGDVNSLDILSIFPFDNYLVIVELPGKSAKMLFDFLSKTRMQAMSKVKFSVKNNEITECLINGEPFDENRSYNVATIDFLLNGGDGLVALGRNSNVIETHVKMMDLILTVVKDLTAQGKVIEKELDSRASWE